MCLQYIKDLEHCLSSVRAQKMLTLLLIHSISIYLALINLLDSMKYIKMRCIPDLSKNIV